MKKGFSPNPSSKTFEKGIFYLVRFGFDLIKWVRQNQKTGVQRHAAFLKKGFPNPSKTFGGGVLLFVPLGCGFAKMPQSVGEGLAPPVFIKVFS